MVVHQEDVEFAKGTLWPEETVMVTATQRRAGPGMNVINPVTVIATDKRVIIINRATMGLRKDIETIPYDRITSVRVEHGFISSSVFLRVSGYTAGETGFMRPGEQEGEIDGLHRDDAKALGDYLDKIISGFQTFGQPQPQAARQQGGAAQSPPGKFIYCPKCGKKNDGDAAFCESCGAKISRQA